MPTGNYRHKSHSSSKQFPRTESYDDNKHSQYKPVRLNQRRAVPCCFCKTRVKCENMEDHNRAKLVPRRNSKRVCYPKAVVQSKELFGQKERLPVKNVAPMRPPELPHRSTAENVGPDDRRKKGRIRREDMIDDVMETVVTWEALLPDGWRPYEPKISNTIEKVYRRVRSLNLEDSDEKKCWQEESYYYQFKQYRISPHFMLQRNMNTGKDRKIRRKKVQLSSKAKHVRPTRRVRTGSRGNSTSLSKVKSEQKHSPPALPLKHHVKKRRKKSGKRRYVDCDLKRDLPEKKDNHNDGDDTNLTLNFKNYKKWETAHVVSWLRILNFPQYCEFVREKGITGKELSNTTITYLVTELKMSVEHATHIFGALEGIKSGFTEHGDDSCNSRFSSLSGQGNTSFSREMKHPIYDSIVDESGRDSMVFRRISEMDGIMIGGGVSGPPPFDKTKMTPTSEGNSLYSVNDSQLLFEDQCRKLSMRSLKLDMKSNFADRMQHTSISIEQKKSKSSLIDDFLVPKESSVHDFEKENDVARRMKMSKMNVDISKRGNSCGSLSKDCEDTEIQLFCKDQSISSGNLTQKIHSRSESLTDRNASHKKSKMLLSKVDNGVQEDRTNVDKPSFKISNEVQQGDQQESVMKGSKHHVMSVRLKHVDDIISDIEENDRANKVKQPITDIPFYKKHSQEIGLAFADSSSILSPKTNCGSPGLVKQESAVDSLSSTQGGNESQRVNTSPSLVVWQER